LKLINTTVYKSEETHRTRRRKSAKCYVARNKARSFLSTILLLGKPEAEPETTSTVTDDIANPVVRRFFPSPRRESETIRGLTNRRAGTSTSHRALSASSVERTRPGRKRGRGYIGGINRIPIRGTCHLTASENLESYSRDDSSPVAPRAELRRLSEKRVARFVHEGRKTLLFDWS